VPFVRMRHKRSRSVTETPNVGRRPPIVYMRASRAGRNLLCALAGWPLPWRPKGVVCHTN
jgi:hypothetical protein